MKILLQDRIGAGIAFCLCFLLSAVCISISATVPPFQSPDEFDHIKRAYLLSKGVIVLDTPSGGNSGGQIDTGLLAYMEAFSPIIFKTDRKLSREDIKSVEAIRWAGETSFNPAPGTGFYFPIIYVPQATALALGEILGMTIKDSYYLARFLSLAAVLIVLFLAFCLILPPPLLLALLILPMSLFQLTATSIDGLSLALSILAISAYLRLVRSEGTPSLAIYGVFVFCTAIVCTSRLQAIPLLFLLFSVFYFFRKSHFLLTPMLTSIAVLSWIFFSISTTTDTRKMGQTSSADLVVYYIGQPERLIGVFDATFSNTDLVKFYRESFIGILGWLDTPLSSDVYAQLIFLIICLALLSISFRDSARGWIARSALLFSAAASTFFVFFSMLLAWTVHPAEYIDGVQGRYFYIPAVMLVYALGGTEKSGSRNAKKISWILLMLLTYVSIWATGSALVKRYYLAEEKLPFVGQLRPSLPLSENQAIKLYFNDRHKELNENVRKYQSARLTRIGVMLGTYVRENEGTAVLALNTEAGDQYFLEFELAELSDNEYRIFDVDNRVYIDGEITSNTGGVSAWEVHSLGNAITTCLLYEYKGGRRYGTRGCPDPKGF